MTFIESKIIETNWIPLNGTSVIIGNTNPWWFVFVVAVFTFIYSELKAKCSTRTTFRQRW